MRKILFVIACLSVWSCSDSTKEDPFLIDSGEEYIPLAVGQNWIYDLDSIIYDPEPGEIVIDTLSYQMKYEVLDTFRNGEGQLSYRIERFVRNTDTSSWRVTDVWTTHIEERRFVWNEENQPFVKLIFPLKEDSKWDGNALFDDDNVSIKIRGENIDIYKFWADYEVISRGAEEVNGTQYEDVITVLQVDREITIEKRYSVEKYARGVGLIFKELIILDTQNENVVIPFEDRAERGFIMRQELKSF